MVIAFDNDGKELRRFEGDPDKHRDWAVTASYVVQAGYNGDSCVFKRDTGEKVADLKLKLRPFSLSFVKGDDVLVYDDWAEKLYRIDF